MNEQYAEQIAKYFEQGWSAQKIANKIANGTGFEGDWNDIYNEAVALQEQAQKKKEDGSGETIPMEPVSFTSVSSEEPSGSLIQGEEPVVQDITAPPATDAQGIAEQYLKRFQEDYTGLLQTALTEDEKFSSAISAITNDSTKSDRQKDYEVQQAISSHLDDRILELMEGYSGEISANLPEDADLTAIADSVYKSTKGALAIPLDGNNRYGGSNFLWDTVKSIGASALDMVSGPISAMYGGIKASINNPFLALTHATNPVSLMMLGLTSEQDTRNLDQAFADVSESIRETQAQQGYGTKGIISATSNGYIGDALFQLSTATGEAVPYIAASALTGGGVAGAVAIGSLGAVNTYIDSEREDYNRVQEGLEPVFDDGTSGTLQRIGYASIIGVAQGAAGPVEARIARAALGKAVINPATANTSAAVIKGMLKRRGIDATLEGVTEAIETGAGGLYAGLVGNQDLNMNDLAFQTFESFVVGVGVGGALQAPSTTVEMFRAGRGVVTGPQAMVNARGERVNLEATVKQSQVESLNRDSFRQLFDETVDSYQSDLREEYSAREKFYRMIAIRYPKTFETIQKIDYEIESLVSSYKQAKQKGASEEDLNAIKDKIYDRVVSRAEITDSYAEEDSNLSADEQQVYEDGIILNKVESAKEEIAVTADAVASHDELVGTEIYDPYAHEEAIEANNEAKENHKELIRLVGEVGAARKKAQESGSEKDALEAVEKENELRISLGMGLKTETQIEASTETETTAQDTNEAEAVIEEQTQTDPTPEQKQQTEQSAQESATAADIGNRGRAGEYSVFTPREDGSMSVVPNRSLTKKQARILNNVSKTLSVVLGSNYSIVVHDTSESGNMADGQGNDTINGYFVRGEDGKTAIHLNMAQIKANEAEGGKGFEAVVAEEVFHALFSQAIVDSYSNNKQEFDSFLGELEALARSTGNEGLIAQVEAKKQAYQQAGYEGAALADEAIAEYVSELLGAVANANQSQTISDKLRALINRFLNKVYGKEAKNFFITDGQSAMEFVQNFNKMLQNGDVLRPAVESTATTERGSVQRPIRPFGLPDTPFKVLYQSISVYSSGNVSKDRVDEMEFTDKWHFVNWYRRQRAQNPRIQMFGFKVDLGDGEYVPLNAEEINKWKMKPVDTRRRDVREKEERRKRLSQLYKEVQERYYKKHGKITMAGSYLSDLIRPNLESMSDSYLAFKQELRDKDEARGVRPAHPLRWDANLIGGDFAESMTNEDFELIERLINEDLGDKPSEEDIMERGAIKFVNALNSSENASSRYKKAQDAFKQALCGSNLGTCSAFSKSFFLQQASEWYRSEASSKLSLANAASAAAKEIEFMIEAVGFDPRDMVSNWIEASQDLLNEFKADPEIPNNIDIDSFAPVVALLDSYTSAGIELVSNVELSHSLMRAGLIRIASGAKDFISSDRIDAIRRREASATLGNVRGERASSMASHLEDINKIISEYTKDGVFQADKFITVAKKRSGKNRTPQLAKMIGSKSEKFANLALGLLGDRYATPIDLNNIDMFNVYTGKQGIFNIDDEGLVVNSESRQYVISRLKDRGVEVNENMSDAEIFKVLSNLKASDNESMRELAKRLYRRMIGNNLAESRRLTAEERKRYNIFSDNLRSSLHTREREDKRYTWDRFSVAQALYMLGKLSWTGYQDPNGSVPFSYTDARNKAKALGRYKISSEFDNILDDGQSSVDFVEASEKAGALKPSGYQRTRSFVLSLSSNKVKASEHQLNRSRGQEVGAKQYVNGESVVLNDTIAAEAISRDPLSRSVGLQVLLSEKNSLVEVTLDKKIKNETGVPVLNISSRGRTAGFGGAVTLKHAKLDVDQDARYKVATFQKTEGGETRIKGEFVSNSSDEANYDGVKATFDPMRSNVFIDASGRPVKSAEEVTIVGNTVYMRGEIEYYDLKDPILKQGRLESTEQKQNRKKGEKAFKRYYNYMKVNGYEMTEESARFSFERLSPGSDVAMSKSEIVINASKAMERASINIASKKMRGTADRMKNSFGSDIRKEITQNPENYIIPQKIKQLKADLRDMTDQELVDIMQDDQLVRLSQRQNDLGVLAISELINRAVLRGETSRIPMLITEAAKYGTGAGRILRHLRELKKSSPAGLFSTIKSMVESKGNRMTQEQEEKVKSLAGELFQKQAIVEDLTARAIRGEKVDEQLNKALEDLKDVERRLDTIANSLVEKGWGDIISTLIVGNLLTPMSQMVNVGANAANLFAYGVGDVIALPIKQAADTIARFMGKEMQDTGRNYSLSAYMYGLQKFGTGFIEAKDVIVTGQEKDVSEWRLSRGLMPIRSLMAATGSGELPVGIDGKASLSQRMKLLAQGTFGIPAETMLRLLSLGDLPFRRFIEGIEVYQEGLALGLEGEALADFIKHPPMRTRQKVAAEGRKITFQEETVASKMALGMINSMERVLADGMNKIPGINGDEFAKVFFRMIIPYRSTPANILSETLTYASPYVGLIRMASELSQGNSRAASQTVAKMAIGAIAMETALMLLSEGILSGPVDWFDDEEKNLSFSEGGFPATSINISALERKINGESTAKQEDDVFFNYMKLGIPGMLMATAAHSVEREDLSKDKFGSPVKFVSEAIMDFFGSSGMSAAGAMTEQSFLQGVNEFLQVLVGQDKERSAENLMKSMVSALSATVLPNTASAIYRAERVYLPDTRVTKDMDFAERLAKKFEYTVKDRMFGLGEVPIRVDWKGDPIKQTPEGSNPVLYQLFDFTKARVGGSEPVSNEVYRLYESTGDVSRIVGTPRFATTRVVDIPQIVSKKEARALIASGEVYSFLDDQEFIESKVYLNTDQINRLMSVAGKQRYNDALRLINSVEYSMMDDEQRMEALNEVNKNYNGIKEYDAAEFKPHTRLMFQILEKIYKDGEWKED